MQGIFNKLFGIKSKNDSFSESDESELINYATIALMGTGIYAGNSMTDDWAIWAKKMQDDLLLFEQNARKYLSPKLFILAGKGWENFSIWYRRKNEDKTTPLQRAVSMFMEALKIEPDNEEAKIALATVLIERIQVRDLNYALGILGQIQNKSSEIQLLVNKAKRWIGEIEFESEFDYTNIQFIPLGFLREERTRCRAMIRDLKRKGKNEEISNVLEHMYRIAILHDASTYVMLYCGYVVDPPKYDACYNQLHIIARNIYKYSYRINGKLIESNNCFFSNNDYKAFEMVFGETDKLFNPISLIK